MPLSRLDRKLAFVRHGVVLAAIARDLGFSRTHVAQVANGFRRHERTELEIARRIGRPHREVFGPLPVESDLGAA